MPNAKLRRTTLRLDAKVLKTVEQLAQEDRRPVSNYLRMLIAKYVAHVAAAKQGQVAA